MQTDFVKQWTDLGANTFESLKELGEINSKTAEKLAAQQLDFMNTCVETGVKQITLLSESKGYKDLLAGQAGFAAQYNDMVMDTIRKTTETMTESKDDMTEWFEKGMEQFTTPLMKTTTKSKTSTVKKAA